MKVGDVVVLKSNQNVRMTVDVVEPEHVNTIWFSVENKLECARFVKDSLLKVKP